MLGANKLSQIPERQMHRVRWVLTMGWLVMIGSLFWDPISPDLANLAIPVNPFRFDPDQCVTVQGQCLAQQPAAIALFVFWSLVVPASILILLVFGHETWRRICPLSFLSQIPRALGIQRKRKVEARGGGATRYELFKVRKDSWLGKYHLYVQFGLLTLGLVARLLVLNSHAIALGIFLVATIVLAIAVGFLYEGKSWCQYFCPMAPVQLVFNGPRGLLGHEAHQGPRQTVTQSMCRSVDKDGNEKSACVGCQSPCIDIDAERNYWETSSKSGRRFVQYGYVGLLLSFFIYYFVYAGSFDYLFSGAWLREQNQIATLFNPGFYFANQSIPIPKVVAVPLTLLAGVGLSYAGLSLVEKKYQNYAKRSQTASPQQVTHTIFSLCTFFCFNAFFFFSGRSLLSAFPFAIHLWFNSIVVLVSTLWLSRTLNRSSELYTRESLANSLRRQLGKLTIDFSRFLEGRSMEDLKAEEVYVLAKVLPGVNQEQSLQVYKGVLRETLEQGNADSASSLEVLRPIRQELNIKDEDHFAVLTELGSVEPELLDPKKRRTRENQLRIESYRQALASMLLDLVDSGMSLQEALQRQRKQLQFLKLEYGMTSEEEEEVLSQVLAGEKTTILRKAEAVLEQMRQLALRDRVLHHPELESQTAVFKFLRLTAVQHKQYILTKQMLGLLEVLGDIPEALELAVVTRSLASNVLPEILQTPDGSLTWKTRLKSDVLAYLTSPEPATPRSANPLHQWAPQLAGAEALAAAAAPDLPNGVSSPSSSALENPESALSLEMVLEELIYELDPLIQAIALYGLNLLDPQQARAKATQMSNPQIHWLVQETVQNILTHAESHNRREVQTLMAQITLKGKVEKQSFQQPVVRVGSSPVNDIVLPAPVAKHHAVFYLDGDDYSVLDLGSSEQGLSVGGKHLDSDRDRLTQGQIIRFGAADDPAITVHWKKQPIQTQQPSEILSTLDKVLLLFESRFFRTLNPDALIELGRNALVKVYARGEQLCHAGDPSDSILLLIDGVAEVLIQRDNTFQTVGMVNVGETVGEMGVLTRQKRSATVAAASAYCRALVIQAEHFDAVLRQDPEVSRNLLVVLSSRLQSMTNKLKSTTKAS
ncbi:MAG: cyclic nucleotide-binding domain-containing protein [Leptolyngbyaceae cyanobacterium bins.349]|nr:cyclic nucleotide-binding domain-containing protein [Leptolyngbyaceae cyanobacterium bins.349]